MTTNVVRDGHYATWNLKKQTKKPTITNHFYFQNLVHYKIQKELMK